MAVLLTLLRPLQVVNDIVLKFGRGVATVAIGLMVICILVQVFFRYALNNALPWPEEAARFLMLWMTGLIAPSAYRRGGFVAIDMIALMLPKMIGAVLNLALLLLAALVLVVGLQLGLKHINSGWLFASATLYLPLELVGGEGFKIKLAWMFMSFYVGLVLLLMVNIELVLRALVSLFGGDDDLRPLIHEDDLVVE